MVETMQTSKKDGHFNESIVNEEILEDMKKNRIDHMKYLPDMEQLEESDVMDQVISAMKAFWKQCVYVHANLYCKLL